MRSIVPTAIVLLLLALDGAAATETYRICTGEKENKCPVGGIDAFFPCYTKTKTMAEHMCKVTVNGKDKIPPYKIIKQGEHGGNKCGYAWFKVTCYDL